MAKVGDIIRVTNNSGHSYKVGEIYKIDMRNYDNSYRSVNLKDNTMGNSIRDYDFEIIYMKSEMKKSIEENEKKLKEIANMKDYLKKNNLTEIDGEDYFILNLIDECNSEKTGEEKIESIKTMLKKTEYIKKWGILFPHFFYRFI